MPSTRRYLIAGLDPTSLDCVSKADLLQMHAAEAPDTDIGFCVTSETTPDAGTYTELSRFLWIKRSTRELYVHDGVSFGLAKSTVSIPAASITYDLLSPSSGTPYYALAVNSAGTAVTFQSLPNLIGASTIADMGVGGTQKFLAVDGGVMKTSGVLPSAFTAKSVAESKVSFGGTAGQYPTSDGTGGLVWGSAPSYTIPDASIVIGKLSASGGSIGQSMRVKSGGVLEYYTPPSQTTLNVCLLEYKTAAGVDGAAMDGTTPNRVPLNNTEYNAGFMTNLAGTGTFELAVGTYLIQAKVQLVMSGGSIGAGFKAQVQLYDETGSALIRTYPCVTVGSTDDFRETFVQCVVAIIASNTFSVRVEADAHTNGDMFLGKAANKNSADEVYSTVLITKLA